MDSFKKGREIGRQNVATKEATKKAAEKAAEEAAQVAKLAKLAKLAKREAITKPKNQMASEIIAQIGQEFHKEGYSILLNSGKGIKTDDMPCLDVYYREAAVWNRVSFYDRDGDSIEVDKGMIIVSNDRKPVSGSALKTLSFDSHTKKDDLLLELGEFLESNRNACQLHYENVERERKEIQKREGGELIKKFLIWTPVVLIILFFVEQCS